MNETLLACEACPTTMPINTFADLLANGWDAMTHTFQRDEFNSGQGIVCTGKFREDERTTIPYVTTPDGRKWSAEAVENLKAEHSSILKQRDKARFDLANLRGKIHQLDLEQRP